MTRYIAIIDYAEGQFGAWFPDAPGCTAMGSTEDEVIANSIDALAEWVADAKADNIDLPAPRPYVELLESGELEQGAMIATIPLLGTDGKLVRANISLDSGLLHSIDEAANQRGMTRSAFLAAAAIEKIRSSV